MYHTRPRKPIPLAIFSALCAVASIASYFLPLYVLKNLPKFFESNYTVFHLISAEFVMLWSSVVGGQNVEFIYNYFAYIMYAGVGLLGVWAILSLIRVKAAGIFGLIASILHTLIGAAWFAYALNNGSILLVASPTFVPYLMPILGVAGIILSIVQIKKN